MGTFRIYPPSKKRMKEIQEGIRRKRERQLDREMRRDQERRRQVLATIAEMDAKSVPKGCRGRMRSHPKPQSSLAIKSEVSND